MVSLKALTLILKLLILFPLRSLLIQHSFTSETIPSMYSCCSTRFSFTGGEDCYPWEDYEDGNFHPRPFLEEFT